MVNIIDKLLGRDTAAEPEVEREPEITASSGVIAPQSDMLAAIIEPGEVTALSFEEQSRMLSKESLLARIMQAAVHEAVVVMGEATNYPGHELRAAFAQRVIHGRSPELSKIILAAVLTNPNCGTEQSDPLVEDTALLYVIAEKWNALSGYSAYIV